MLKHVDECVGCPPEKGCLGSACPNRNVPRWFCDECENEFERDELRVSMASSFAMTVSVRKRGSVPRNRRTNREDKR